MSNSRQTVSTRGNRYESHTAGFVTFVELVRRDLAREILRPLMLGITEEQFWCIFLDNLAVVREDHATRDEARKPHLVNHADHGQAILRKGRS